MMLEGNGIYIWGFLVIGLSLFSPFYYYEVRLVDSFLALSAAGNILYYSKDDTLKI